MRRGDTIKGRNARMEMKGKGVVREERLERRDKRGLR